MIGFSFCVEYPIKAGIHYMTLKIWTCKWLQRKTGHHTVNNWVSLSFLQNLKKKSGKKTKNCRLALSSSLHRFQPFLIYIYNIYFFNRYFDIPMEILPKVRSSSEIYGLMVSVWPPKRELISVLMLHNALLGLCCVVCHTTFKCVLLRIQYKYFFACCAREKWSLLQSSACQTVTFSICTLIVHTQNPQAQKMFVIQIWTLLWSSHFTLWKF